MNWAPLASSWIMSATALPWIGVQGSVYLVKRVKWGGVALFEAKITEVWFVFGALH